MPKSIIAHLLIKTHVAPWILHVSLLCRSSDKEVLLYFRKICYGKNEMKGEPVSGK